MEEPSKPAEIAARPRRPLGEVLVVFALATAGTVAVTQLAAVLPGLEGYVHLLVGALFLGMAVKLARREPAGMQRHGIDLAGLLDSPDADDARPPGPFGLYDLARALRTAAPSALRETGAALAVAAVVFPPFVVGFYLYHGPAHTFSFVPPDDFGSFALTQLLVVALPEEALFRGYAQTRLGERWNTSSRLLRVPIDLRVLLLQAALFAVLHFASIPHPARLAVFFPGLLFGWMRAWRGGIGAAMLFHAMSNVLAEILQRGWLT